MGKSGLIWPARKNRAINTIYFRFGFSPSTSRVSQNFTRRRAAPTENPRYNLHSYVSHPYPLLPTEGCTPCVCCGTITSTHLSRRYLLHFCSLFFRVFSHHQRIGVIIQNDPIHNASRKFHPRSKCPSSKHTSVIPVQSSYGTKSLGTPTATGGNAVELLAHHLRLPTQ